MAVSIYAIYSDLGNDIYIGQTIYSLKERLVQHTCASNMCTSQILFNQYGIDNCKIELLEEVLEEEKLIREQYWIETFGDQCINKIRVSYTKDEAYEKHRQRMKQHYDNNKEKYKAYYRNHPEIKEREKLIQRQLREQRKHY